MKNQELKKSLKLMLTAQELAGIDPYSVSVSGSGYDIAIQGHYKPEINKKLVKNKKWKYEMDDNGYTEWTRRIGNYKIRITLT